MKKIILVFILFANTINCLAQDSIYHLGPDSQRKEGVAKGLLQNMNGKASCIIISGNTMCMFLHNTIQLNQLH